MKRVLFMTALVLACFLACEKEKVTDYVEPTTRGGALTVSITDGQTVSESLDCQRAEFQANYNELRRQMMAFSPSKKTVHAVSASEVIRWKPEEKPEQ